MQDDRHTDGRVAQLASGSTRSRAFPSTRSHPGTHESAVQDGRARGRSATHPLEVPARGWKDILFRVWKNIGKDRVIVVAAGVTFYSVLALFPAIAALVAVYGFFADPTTIASHLDSIAGMVPTGAIDVIRDQITRVASQGRATLGLTFLAGFAASLWSANAGMKSLFDALNLVYNEPEKRGFIWLNLISLIFTMLTITFALLAMGAMVIVPIALNFVGLGGVTETVIKIARWPALGRSRCRHRAATACPAGVGNSRINLRETAYRSYQTDTRRRPPRARTSCLVRQIKNGALRAKARKRSQPYPDRSRINTCAENLKRFGGKAL